VRDRRIWLAPCHLLLSPGEVRDEVTLTLRSVMRPRHITAN